MQRKAKALVLFSGGLDSILAVRLLQEQGIETELVWFVNPFSSERHDIRKLARQLGAKLHVIPLGKDYFDVIRNPRHGYGSGMNPCIDCKIHMYRLAKRLAEKTGADFIATGEVLGERPFSQNRKALMLIEREAGLENRVVRPLSAKLLPETQAEKAGLVNREKLLDIRGRRRVRQIELAKRFGIKEYPSPAGGCLLTDKQFSARLKDLFENQKEVTPEDIELLRLGRHFRFKNSKIVVGRNEEENKKLLEIASKTGLVWMEVSGHPGPVSVVRKPDEEVLKKAAELTAYYSDAPKEGETEVIVVSGRKKKIINVNSPDPESVRGFMIE